MSFVQTSEQRLTSSQIGLTIQDEPNRLPHSCTNWVRYGKSLKEYPSTHVDHSTEIVLLLQTLIKNS